MMLQQPSNHNKRLEHATEHEAMKSEAQLLEASSSFVSDANLIAKSCDTTIIEEQASIRQFQNELFDPNRSSVNNSIVSRKNVVELQGPERVVLISRSESRGRSSDSKRKSIKQLSTNGSVPQETAKERVSAANEIETRKKQKGHDKDTLYDADALSLGADRSCGQSIADSAGGSASKGILDESSRYIREEETSISEKKLMHNPLSVLTKIRRESEEEIKAEFRGTANFQTLVEKKSVGNQLNSENGQHFNPFHLTPIDYDLHHRPSGNFGLQAVNYQPSHFTEIRETQAEYRDSEYEGTNHNTRQTKRQLNMNESENESEAQSKELGFNLQRAGNYSMHGLGGIRMIGLEEVFEEDTEDTKDISQLGVPLFKNMFYHKHQDQSVSLNLSKLKEESVVLPSIDSKVSLQENNENNVEGCGSKAKLDDQKENEPGKTQTFSKSTTPAASHNATKQNTANFLSELGENSITSHMQEKTAKEDQDAFKKIAQVAKEGNLLDELNNSIKIDSQPHKEEQKLVDISNYDQKHHNAPLEKKMSFQENEKHKQGLSKAEVDFINMKLDISGIQNLVNCTLEELDGDQSFSSRRGEKVGTRRSKQVSSSQKIKSLEQLLLSAKSDSKRSPKAGFGEDYEVFQVMKPEEPQTKQRTLNEKPRETKRVEMEGICIDSESLQNSRQRRSRGSSRLGSRTSLNNSLAEISKDNHQLLANKVGSSLEQPKFGIRIIDKNINGVSRGEIAVSSFDRVAKIQEQSINKDPQDEKINMSYSNPFTEQESYASQDARNVIEELFSATLGKGTANHENKTVKVEGESKGRYGRSSSLTRGAVIQNSSASGLSVFAHSQTKKQPEFNVRESFDPKLYQQPTLKMSQPIIEPSQTGKVHKTEGKITQAEQTATQSAQNQKIMEPFDRASLRSYSREKVRGQAIPESTSLPSRGSHNSHPRSQSKGPDTEHGRDDKEVSEPPHNRPAMPTSILSFPSRSDPTEGNTLLNTHAPTAFASNFSYEHAYSSQQYSITIRSSHKSLENANYVKIHSRGTNEPTSHTISQRNTTKDRESIRDLNSSCCQRTSSKSNLRPQDLYRVHSTLQTDVNTSLCNQSYLQEKTYPINVPIISIKPNVHRSVSSPTTKFGFKVKGEATFRPITERKINMDVFCINCEEFVNIDQVDAHSTLCVKKIEQRPSRPKKSVFDDEEYGDADQVDIEETNQKIERIIMKLNDSLKSFSKRIRPEFAEYCKRIVKVARDVVSEDSDCELLKKKLKDFDQLFAPMSRTTKEDEIRLLFYIQRMFVALKNKAEALEEYQKIALLEEKLQACDHETHRKKAELEMWQYQSDMLQKIHRNDSRNYKYLRNDPKKDLEVISQIHSDIAVPVGNSEESAGTVESEAYRPSTRPSRRNSQADREVLRRYFYTEAVNIKLTLPSNHCARDFLISELYDECIANNIPREGYVHFIKKKYQLI